MDTSFLRSVETFIQLLKFQLTMCSDQVAPQVYAKPMLESLARVLDQAETIQVLRLCAETLAPGTASTPLCEVQKAESPLLAGRESDSGSVFGVPQGSTETSMPHREVSAENKAPEVAVK